MLRLFADTRVAITLFAAALLSLTGMTCDAQDTAQKTQDEEKAEINNDELPLIEMETSKGKIVIEMYEDEAPNTVANFITLVESDFYDGLIFHRVLQDFMAQGGCPDGTGRGNPGYSVKCECYDDKARKHERGSLSMAHAGKDTGGSQFFLCLQPQAHLDGKHTVFGKITEGLDVLDKIQLRDPRQGGPADKMVKVTVKRKRDHEYKVEKIERNR